MTLINEVFSKSTSTGLVNNIHRVVFLAIWRTEEGKVQIYGYEKQKLVDHSNGVFSESERCREMIYWFLFFWEKNF